MLQLYHVISHIVYHITSHYIHLVLWTKIKLARGHWLYSLTVASQDGFSMPVSTSPLLNCSKTTPCFWFLIWSTNEEYNTLFIRIWSTKEEHMYFKNLQNTFSKYKSSQCTSGFSNFTSKANPFNTCGHREFDLDAISQFIPHPMFALWPLHGALLRLRRTHGKKLVLVVVGNHSCCIRHHFGKNLWKGIQVILIRSLTQLSCQTRSRWRTRSVEVHLCHRRKLRQVLFPNSKDSPNDKATTALILLNEIFKQFDGILIYNNQHVYKHTCIYIYIISIYIYTCVSHVWRTQRLFVVG